MIYTPNEILKSGSLVLPKISLIFIVTLLFSSCSYLGLEDEEVIIDETEPDITSSLIYTSNTSIETELFELTNEYRISIGKEPLERYTLADIQALLHNVHMIEQNKLSHDNLAVRTAYFLGLGFTYVKENVGVGHTTAEGLFNAWLQSEAHRNIIESNGTTTGISVLMNENGVYFFTQIYLN